MKKVDFLILLIKTLSKSEKKAIRLQSNLTAGKKMYMHLYKLVNDKNITDSLELQSQYCKKYSKASFHTEVAYLYDFILDVLTKIKMSQDKDLGLYKKLLNLQILKDRDLYANYYAALKSLEKEAADNNNYNVLLIIRELELLF